MRKIIAVTGGVGGVGKTSIALNLAASLCSAGKKVCLLTADPGAGNVNAHPGSGSGFTFADFMEHGKSLDKIIAPPISRVKTIAGGTGIAQITHLEDHKYKTLLVNFNKLDIFDFMIVDTSAGITTSNMAFALSADETIILFTTNPNSLPGALSAIEIMMAHQYPGVIYGLPNNFATQERVDITVEQMRESIAKGCNGSIVELAYIPADLEVLEAVRSHKPFCESSPGCRAAQAIGVIANRIIKDGESERATNPSFYIKKVIHLAGNKMLNKFVIQKNSLLPPEKEYDDPAIDYQPIAVPPPDEPAQVPPPVEPAPKEESVMEVQDMAQAPETEDKPAEPSLAMDGAKEMVEAPTTVTPKEPDDENIVTSMDRTDANKVNPNVTINLSDIRKAISGSGAIDPLPMAILESQKSISTVMEKNIVMHEKVIETLLKFASGGNGSTHASGNGNGNSNGKKIAGKGQAPNEELVQTEDGLHHVKTDYINIDEYISSIMNTEKR